jgi:hypothetical protein
MDSDRRQRPPYLLLALGVLALLIAVAAAGITFSRRHHNPLPKEIPASAGPTSSAPGWTPSIPALPDDVTESWAYLDSTEGNMLLGGDSDLRPLGRLIVPGLAEDYLNTLDQRHQTVSPHDTVMLTGALAGNSEAGDQLIAASDLFGGSDQAAKRIVDSCQLVTAELEPPRATAIDVAHYAACLREGALINPDRAGWVLDQMRQTAGGIGDVRGNDGGQRLAQFNATEPAGGGMMRTGCMGVGAYWSAAVFVDWPAGRGDLYGVAACAEVARAEFPPDTQQAPDSPAPADTSSSATAN